MLNFNWIAIELQLTTCNQKNGIDNVIVISCLINLLILHMMLKCCNNWGNKKLQQWLEGYWNQIYVLKTFIFVSNNKR